MTSREIETVTVEQAPAITGLHFQHVAHQSNAEALLRVHDLCAEHDQVDRLSSIEHTPTLEDLARDIARALHNGHAHNWLLAYIGEELVGYSRINWWTETDGMWVYLTLGWVVPTWRGKGIGTAMLHWAETRIQELASEHPTGGRWEYASNATNTELEATALLRENGYDAAYAPSNSATSPRCACIRFPSFLPRPSTSTAVSAFTCARHFPAIASHRLRADHDGRAISGRRSRVSDTSQMIYLLAVATPLPPNGSNRRACRRSHGSDRRERSGFASRAFPH